MNTSRPQYRFSEIGVGSTANNYGNYILKPGAGEIRKPTWSRTETVIRILPQWNFDDNCWEPYRRSSAPMDFGDWIRRYDAVRSFGENGITMLLYDPTINPAYDLQTNPCVILYRAIDSAINARQSEPDWPALLRGGVGRKAWLTKPQSIYIVRCGIFRIKSKDMVDDDRAPLGLGSDAPYFMELPRSAGEKLIAMLEEQNPDNAGDPTDYNDYFKYGDIVSLDHGAYIHIFEDGADPRDEQENMSSAPKQLTVPTGYGSRTYSANSNSFKGYDIYISDKWKGYSAQLNSADLIRIIRNKQRRWEDCLQFFTHQEQAFLIQDGFPPSAILYAWRDHPEWIKDETRSKAVGRVSESFNFSTPTPQTEKFRLMRNTESVLPKQQGKVGGWGDKSFEDDEADLIKDSVVPVIDEDPYEKLKNRTEALKK